MKKIIIFPLVLIVVFSFSVPVFADSVLEPDYPSDEIPDYPDVVATDYVFTVGTTGGGQEVNVPGSLCLATALIYFASDGYPSFSETYKLATKVWKMFSQYEQNWFQSNCAVLLEYPVRVPALILTEFNSHLNTAGSSVRLPSNLYALGPIPFYYDLNNTKSTQDYFLTKDLFEDKYGDNWNDVFLSEIKGLSAFSDRLQKALVVGLQNSFDATYNQVVTIRQTLYDWNQQLESEHEALINRAMETEDKLIALGRDGFHRGLYFLRTTEKELGTYTDGFYFVSLIFDLIYEIAFLKILVYLSLSIGMFSFVVNIGESIGVGFHKDLKKERGKKNNGGG